MYFWGQNRLKQLQSIVNAKVHSWCLYYMGFITLCRGSVCWPFIQLKGRHSKNESMPAVLLFRSRPDKNHHSIQNCVNFACIFFSWALNVRFILFFVLLHFGQNDQKQKNQLHCLRLKMTADFRKFVAEFDKKNKKRKMK